MTKALIAVGGLGGVSGLFGAVQLISGVDGQGPLVWIAGGLALVVLSQVWAVQRAITDRNAALQSARAVSQKVIEMGEGASLTRSHFSNIRMSTGPETSPISKRPRRRWFSRVLEDADRQDLARRCEECSREMLEWLYRAERVRPEDDFRVRQQAWEAHRAETEREFNVRYVARARDLLNECVEAGYSLDAKLEAIRVNAGIEGEVQWYNWHEFAQGLGIVGRRVSRRAKRL